MAQAPKQRTRRWIAKGIFVTSPDARRPSILRKTFRVGFACTKNESSLSQFLVVLEPGDSPKLQLSNFSVLEDRETGTIEIYLTRLGADPDDFWGADAYKYTLRFE